MALLAEALEQRYDDYARFAGLAWRHPLVEREGPLR